jgi:hypothetical protein
MEVLYIFGLVGIWVYFEVPENLLSCAITTLWTGIIDVVFCSLIVFILIKKIQKNISI